MPTKHQGQERIEALEEAVAALTERVDALSAPKKAAPKKAEPETPAS